MRGSRQISHRQGEPRKLISRLNAGGEAGEVRRARGASPPANKSRNASSREAGNSAPQPAHCHTLPRAQRRENRSSLHNNVAPGMFSPSAVPPLYRRLRLFGRTWNCIIFIRGLRPHPLCALTQFFKAGNCCSNKFRCSASRPGGASAPPHVLRGEKIFTVL